MRYLPSLLALITLLSLSGCGDVQCDGDADCAEGEVCAEAGGVLFASRICVAASDVITNNSTSDMASDLSTLDMAADMSITDDDMQMAGDMQPDAQAADMSGTDMPCVPRSSQDICNAIRADCGSPMVEECGATITINCGQCESPDVCQNNQCVCEPETNADFCSRFGANCGTITNLDNCGDMRTVDCGTCSGNQQCGEQSPNVCGCPCQIAGTCYPDNAVNPANPCEVCDSQRSTTQWTVAAGRSCSDGDLCTTNDACQADGTCQGDTVDCTASSQCRTSSCNPASGACVETDVPDGNACIGSGPNCVSHTCQSGACQSSIDSGTCLISGTCYPGGTSRPGNLCEQCRPNLSQTSWSNASSGTMCESDGLSCTVDACDGNGTCTYTLTGSNTCLISGECYNEEDRNPARVCEWCEPSNSRTSWSIAANQQCNDEGLNCTLDICNASGQCTHPVQSGHCLIGGTCYDDTDRNPSSECEWCDSSVSTSAWSNVTAGVTCSEDGIPCTDDICDGSGTCDHPISSNQCYINMTCYSAGETTNFNCCRGCNPLNSQTMSTPINDGMTCSFNCGGGPGTCQNGTCTDGMNLCIPDGCPL